MTGDESEEFKAVTVQRGQEWKSSSSRRNNRGAVGRINKNHTWKWWRGSENLQLPRVEHHSRIVSNIYRYIHQSLCVHEEHWSWSKLAVPPTTVTDVLLRVISKFHTQPGHHGENTDCDIHRIKLRALLGRPYHHYFISLYGDNKHFTHHVPACFAIPNDIVSRQEQTHALNQQHPNQCRCAWNISALSHDTHKKET